MSEIFSVASLVVSTVGLLITVAAYRRLDNEASDTFAVIGADEGNHEARLEVLEHHAGLRVIPSPSALEVIEDEENENPTYGTEFAHGQEDAELRADEKAQDAATSEGMAHGY